MPADPAHCSVDNDLDTFSEHTLPTGTASPGGKVTSAEGGPSTLSGEEGAEGAGSEHTE